MYLGLDLLLSPDKKIYLSEVNIGLPGGAFEYDIAHKTIFGEPSDVFEKIEEKSQRYFKKSFRDYIHSLPFIDELKEFKLFLDRERSLPLKLNPVLRLEDKWVQYQLLNKKIQMPYTEIFNSDDPQQIEKFKTNSRRPKLQSSLLDRKRDLGTWRRLTVSKFALRPQNIFAARQKRVMPVKPIAPLV